MMSNAGWPLWWPMGEPHPAMVGPRTTDFADRPATAGDACVGKRNLAVDLEAVVAK